MLGDGERSGVAVVGGVGGGGGERGGHASRMLTGLGDVRRTRQGLCPFSPSASQRGAPGAWDGGE